jgi:hypothetical protein
MAKFVCEAQSSCPEGPGPPPEASEKPGRSGEGESQRASGLTINLIVVQGLARAHTPNGVSLYARWLLLRVFGVGQSEGSEPSHEAAPTLMREAGAPNTRKCEVCCGKRCARPTGGRHGRTTNAPAQRLNGSNLRGTLEVG